MDEWGSPILAPASPTVLEAGTIVGEYRVEHKLGEGGMSVVYAAVHPLDR